MSSGFGWLYAAEAAFGIASKWNEHNEASISAYNSQRQANRQAALNNNLAFNALLNINEEEALNYKKQAIDKFELQKDIQRALASQLARDGSANKSGGSVNSILMNIERQGLNALYRKDFNFHVKLRNLQQQRQNIALETASKNNQVFAQIQGFPSSTGLGLSIGATALQTGLRYKEGLRTKSKSTPIISTTPITPTTKQFTFGEDFERDFQDPNLQNRFGEYI